MAGYQMVNQFCVI